MLTSIQNAAEIGYPDRRRQAQPHLAGAGAPVPNPLGQPYPGRRRAQAIRLRRCLR